MSRVFDFIRVFIIVFAAVSACIPSIANAEADNNLKSYLQRLWDSVTPKADRYPLVRLKNDGRVFDLHSQPNSSALIAVRLNPSTRFVQLLRRCTPNWCFVRLGAAVGWLGRDRFLHAPYVPQVARTPAIEEIVEQEKEDDGPPLAFANIPLPVRKGQPPPRRTAPLVAGAQEADKQQRGPELQEVSHIEKNIYALKEIYGRIFLPVQQAPDGNSPISGKIPFFAKDVEALGKCVDDWCLIRRGAVQGWIRQRHLTDGPGVAEPRLQLEEVMPLDILNVYSAPTKEAGIVARINPPATDIKPLETCNEDWCNVRYLNTVGWVEPRYLTRQ